MTALFTWSGVPIDPDLLPSYGYVDPVSVGGVTLPRYLAYSYAGMLDQAAQIVAGAASINSTVTAANASVNGTATAANASIATAVAGVGTTIAATVTGLVGSSASSLAIGTGAKAFTAQAGKSWQPGMILAATRAADANAYMIGTVTSYVSGTGALALNVLDARGSGTFTDWNLAIAGRSAPGLAGWSPVLSLVADGARIVAQVTGWIGGEGTMPPTGGYVGASGLVVPIASAVDLRGPAGATGAGSTINAQVDGTTITASPRSAINLTSSLHAADDAANGRINIALDGDSSNPGALAFYGTDSGGNKGFRPIQQADASTNGSVRLATAAEARAGSDASKVITPATLAAAGGRVTTATRSSNTILAAADAGKLIACTGTWTQTLTAAATLGAGWSVYFSNEGTGVITIDPNGAELIAGLAAINVYPGEGFLLTCDGTAFRCIGRQKGWLFVSSTVISSTIGQADFEQPFSDPEISGVMLEGVDIAFSSAPSTIQITVKKLGAYLSSSFADWGFGQNSGSAITGTASGAALNLPITAPASFVVRVSSLGPTQNGPTIEAACGRGGGFHVGAPATSVGATQGLRVSGGGGLTSGTLRLSAFRG